LTACRRRVDASRRRNRAAAGLDSAQAAVDDAAKKATKFFNKLF
jgi:hypothetical protein